MFEQLSVYLFYAALVAMVVIQPSHPAVWGAILLLLLWRGIMQTWVYKRLARTMDMPPLGMKVLLYEWLRPAVNLYYYFSARRQQERKLYMVSYETIKGYFHNESTLLYGNLEHYLIWIFLGSVFSAVFLLGMCMVSSPFSCLASILSSSIFSGSKRV